MTRTVDEELLRSPAPERAQRTARRYALTVGLAFLAVVPAAYITFAHSGATYTTEGVLTVEDGSPQHLRSDPVEDQLEYERAPEPAEWSPWIELLRSSRVLDPVVLDRQLHIQHGQNDAPSFASLGVAQEYVPGEYELRIGEDGETFVLVDGQGSRIEMGTLGSPIGRDVGFLSTPPASSFQPGATVPFTSDPQSGGQIGRGSAGPGRRGARGVPCWKGPHARGPLRVRCGVEHRGDAPGEAGRHRRSPSQ